jgi:nucleotide-binding universal stress UspA family protein
MDTSQVPAGTIVVGIDGSTWSDEALDWAIDQAALEQRALTIVHAIPSMGAQSMGLYAGSGLDFVQLLDDAKTDAHKLLKDAVSHARDRGPDLVVHDVLSLSDPRTALLALGEHAEMVVVGSRGRGPVASLLLGSVSVSVSKHALCPVVVLRPHAATFGRGVLLGVDGTEGSVAATEFAFRLAALRGLPLTVLHADLSALSIPAPAPSAADPDLSEQRALVSESLAGMGEKYPEVQVIVHLVNGFADHQLIKLSVGFDLVVVGHHQLNRLADVIYGSVAPAVLEHADGAVAVVPYGSLTSEHPSGV